jgi:hypothetical protein
MLKQVELSTHRFRKYLESSEAIRSEEVSKYRTEWMQKALDRVPDRLLRLYSRHVKLVF